MHRNEKKLAPGSIEIERALCREADAYRPSFSDALHDRVMEAVRSEPIAQLAAPRPRGNGKGILVTVATVLMLLGTVAWGVASRSIESKTIAPPIVDSSHAKESSGTSLAATTDWDATDRWIETMALQIEDVQRSSRTLEAEWVDQPLAAWNHDAKVLVDWALDPITLVARGP